MDVDLVNIITEKRKIQIEKNLKREASDYLKIFFNKKFIEYAGNFLIRSEKRILDIYSPIETWIINNNKYELVQHELIYTVMLDRIHSDMKILRKIDNKNLFTKNYSDNNPRLLNDWVGWINKDSYDLKNKYGEPLGQVAMINSSGKRIIREWENFGSE